MDLITKKDERPVTAYVIVGIIMIACAATGSFAISQNHPTPTVNIQ